MWSKTYSDAWSIARRPGGNIQSAFRSYHTCKAKAGEADGCCATVINNQAWLRRHDHEPWASGQRWYCNCCNARSRTTRGMLIDIHAADGNVYWIVRQVPGRYA